MPMESVPSGMPCLDRGHHRNPEAGACLMEYVSVLAGEPFSDRPRCVDPLLATLAWWINDHVNDRIRADLVVLAPRFIGTSGLGCRLAPSLVTSCSSFGLTFANAWDRMHLERIQRGAQAQLRRYERRSGRSNHVLDCWYRLAHAELALRQVLAVVAGSDPAALPTLLDVALRAAQDVRSTTSPAGDASAVSRTVHYSEP